ncbi:LysR substrate-binding domain-containing protein [Curvivirga sp.]|uniref:LysR substrate-binding domain-containing protein n=1 Tax=Curvivirga sp. TaxID=2856848 RepID=UPI003B593194
MAYNLPPLNWLRSFEAAARKVSFTAAADELNLTAAAVSYQVRSLEEHLGFPLFERLPRSLRLTEMGRAYLPSVRKAFGELSSSTVGLFGVQGETSITVRAPISFTTQWLAPNMSEFRDAYPEVGIRIYTSNWVDKLMGEKVDIDIRYGDGNWDGEVAELVYEENTIIVASESYIKKFGEINSLQDLQKHSLIHVMGVKDSWEQLFRKHEIEFEDDISSIKVDSSLVAMKMAMADQGIALLYRSFAQEALDDQKLIEPLHFEEKSEFSHYLILPDARTKPRPEVLLFRDWLRDKARKDLLAA